MALAAGDAEPTILVPHEGGVRPWLHNVALIEGSPTLIYISSYSICDVTTDCEGRAPALDLVIMDLETGAIDNLGMLGSWDTSVRSTSFGGGVFAHSWATELDYPFVAFHDLEGGYVAHPDICEIDEWADRAYVCHHVSITPDGASLATLGDPCFVGPWSDADSESCPAEVRVFDVASGELTFSVPVGMAGDRLLWIDADESRIVATTSSGIWVLGLDAPIIDEIAVTPGHGGRAVIWRGPTVERPPHLTITDPPHKGVVTTATYTFRGTTDPGCTVSVGDSYFATVADDGTWELDLTLPPGRSSTTITATKPDTGDSTSESIRVYHVVLQPDGLGIVNLGDPADQVVRTLTEVFGAPSSDETLGWQDDWGDMRPTGPVICGHGFVCYEQDRVVVWSHVGLYIVMSDVPFESGIEDWPPPHVAMNLIHYSAYEAQNGLQQLTNEDGIGPGSTVENLRATYGEDVSFWVGGCGETPGFTIETLAGRLWGDLRPPPGTMWDHENPVFSPDMEISSIHIGQWGSC